MYCVSDRLGIFVWLSLFLRPVTHIVTESHFLYVDGWNLHLESFTCFNFGLHREVWWELSWSAHNCCLLTLFLNLLPWEVLFRYAKSVFLWEETVIICMTTRNCILSKFDYVVLEERLLETHSYLIDLPGQSWTSFLSLSNWGKSSPAFRSCPQVFLHLLSPRGFLKNTYLVALVVGVSGCDGLFMFMDHYWCHPIIPLLALIWLEDGGKEREQSEPHLLKWWEDERRERTARHAAMNDERYAKIINIQL